MRTLTITTMGQVTLGKDVLTHLGVGAGEDITVTKLPDGRIEIRAARTEGKISDVFGFLKKPGGPILSVEEINETAKQGWASTAE